MPSLQIVFRKRTLHVYKESIYIYIYAYIYKELFSKSNNRHSKKWVCNANKKLIDCHLVKSFSNMHRCICMHIFMKSSCKKYHLQTWHCHCKLDFWTGAYRVLENSSSYVYMLEFFSKTPSMNLSLALKIYFFGIALIAFRKRALHIYTNACMCISTFMYTSVQNHLSRHG